jgi:hypothetical protein
MTTVGIPGFWQNRSEIRESLITQDLLFAGFILLDHQTKFHVQLEVAPYDPDLAVAFGYAGGGLISEKELERIANHEHTLYLICESQEPKDLQMLMHVGAKVLQAGGLAVKVETSGIAHSKERWMELTHGGNENSLYQALVAKVRHEEGLYTCGMHQFGMRDAIVYDAMILLDDAAQLLNGFLLYLMLEKPEIQVGHSFSLGEVSSWYRIGVEECTSYEADHPYYNPFGLWSLKPMRK